MSGGYVPQEVLDNPEVAAERIKLAAQKAHRATVVLWERPFDALPFKSRSMHPKSQRKDELSWVHDDFSYEVSTWGRGELEQAEFCIMRKFEVNSAYFEIWSVRPDKIKRVEIAFPLSSKPYLGGPLMDHGGEVVLRVHLSQLEDTRKKFEQLSDDLEQLLQPSLPDLAASAEKFAAQYEIATKHVRSR